MEEAGGGERQVPAKGESYLLISWQQQSKENTKKVEEEILTSTREKKHDRKQHSKFNSRGEKCHRRLQPKTSNKNCKNNHLVFSLMNTDSSL